MTTTQRDGVLTIANGRLKFVPEVYPVEHLRNEGWRKEPDGSWTAPLIVNTLYRLCEFFPHVHWQDDVTQWERGIMHQGQSPLKTLVQSLPAHWDQLFPYQQRAAGWLAQQRSGLVGISPGLGKTIIALTALQMLQAKRVLIVCPLTLLSNWEREARCWWPQANIVKQEPEIFGLTDLTPLLSVITYDTFRRAVYERVQKRNELGQPLRKADGTPVWVYQPRKDVLREWKRHVDVLLFDESVLLKSRDAIRTRAASVRSLIPICWELTGSPTTRFLDDLHAQLKVLEPKQYPSYWRFTSRYCLIKETVWGRQVVANVPGAEEQVKRDTKHLTYFYNYTDLARDDPSRAIPEWVFETRQVPLPEKWWRLYKQMQDKFMADLPDGERVLASNTLARLVRLLQLASHPALLADAVGGDPDSPDFSGYDWSTKGGKLSAAAGMIEELSGPTILWTAFVSTGRHLAEQLKAPLLIGPTPTEERTRIVGEFQEGKHPVLVAHPGVGRFGLTLTKGRSSVYVERDYNGDYWVQSLYRTRRIGTTEPPQIVVLEATGPDGAKTVDALIGRVLGYRLQKATEITTSFVKEVLQ